jgi:hypothetical protein
MTAVGVPLITPVEVSNVKPAGRFVEREYEITDPVIVGESGVIAEFFVNTFGEVYDNEIRGISFTVIVISNVVLPPVFVAVIIYALVLEI